MPHSSIRRYLRHGTFPQLSVFEAVARHGSYTRAAEELYMAQPTVSVQIRKLTETIGLPLLEQAGKTVRLTPVGKELRASCGELFQTLARFEQKVANLRGLQTGSLEIAVCGTAKCFASRLLAGFVRNHPDITVRMHVGPRQSLLERITANMDDLYLMADPPANLETVSLRMGPNPIVVLAHPEHRLAGRTGVPFVEFAKEPLLVREPGSGTRTTTERVFAGHGASPIVRMELGSSEAILEALAAGVGVSILPRQVVGPDLAARLTEIDVEGFPLESHWYLVHPVGKQLSFIAQAFLDLVRARAPQPETPGLPPSMIRCA